MSGKNKRLPSYYFDACVYLAYLRWEEANYGKPRIRAIESIWKQSERGGVIIATSAITLTEVLSHKLDSKSEKNFFKPFRQGFINARTPHHRSQCGRGNTETFIKHRR